MQTAFTQVHTHTHVVKFECQVDITTQRMNGEIEIFRPRESEFFSSAMSQYDMLLTSEL